MLDEAQYANLWPDRWTDLVFGVRECAGTRRHRDSRRRLGTAPQRFIPLWKIEHGIHEQHTIRMDKFSRFGMGLRIRRFADTRAKLAAYTLSHQVDDLDLPASIARFVAAVSAARHAARAYKRQSETFNRKSCGYS